MAEPTSENPDHIITILVVLLCVVAILMLVWAFEGQPSDCPCGKPLAQYTSSAAPTPNGLCEQCRSMGWWKAIRALIKSRNASIGTVEVLQALPSIKPTFVVPAHNDTQGFKLMTPSSTIYSTTPTQNELVAKRADVILLRVIHRREDDRNAL